ncbi:MAG: VWA domain-containing protein [Gammaproteobacteria bacterium]|nr:VWA domain-containing protein [Gammaproteobacteria bacterium]MCH9716122.1 VWA domain-containing protein [Gammaproteobacteria bacterium]MCH9762964.1 VWA domain-containing protein [Gammaproteobacteria bacterium]
MFELTTPLALLALPVPFMLWFCLPRAKQSHQSTLKIPFFDLVAPIQTPSRQNQTGALAWLYLIWVLIVCAAAGPRWVGAPLSLTHEGHNIMLVLDISGSMEIRDHAQHGQPKTRLDLVKQAAEHFVKHRTDSQIGLILFGTRAYLQTPLTKDHATVLMRLKDATVGLAGKTTALGDALGLAVKHMQHVPKKGRVIILLTDGANNSGMMLPLKAAELAKHDNIKVYTIGLSSGNSVPLFGGMPVVADDLDEPTLKTIASMTQGQYFHATDKRSLEHIYQLINQLETVTHDNTTIRPEHLFYPYPLALALIFFMLWLTLSILRGQRT